jgi:glycerol kinase
MQNIDLFICYTIKQRKMVMPKYVAAIDQGTTSTRFIIFDHGGSVVALDQKEHDQIYPKPGWVEHDAVAIWENTKEVMQNALKKAKCSVSDIAAIGVTNQRETAVVWDQSSGKPIYNAIVWQDTRTDEICDELARDGGQDRLRSKTGLPLATYFSGPKIKWILENVKDARTKAEKGELIFGNMDTWIIWNLTGRHVTDVTNASRTLLMNLNTLDWDDDLLCCWIFHAGCFPRSVPHRRDTASRNIFWRVCLFPAIWVTSRLRCLDRPVSVPAKRRIPMAPAASC